MLLILKISLSLKFKSLSAAKSYELLSTDEKSVANKHCNDTITKFAVRGLGAIRLKLHFFFQERQNTFLFFT